MELKQIHDIVKQALIHSFNRTFMELKLHKLIIKFQP